MVPRLYGHQKEWFDQLREMRWVDMPRGGEMTIPVYKQLVPKPCILVFHLFSGRRRERDFHWWMSEWGDRRGIQVKVISADTAVSQY